MTAPTREVPGGAEVDGAARALPAPGLLQLPGAAFAGAWLAIVPTAVALFVALSALLAPLSRALTAHPTPSQMPLPSAAAAVRPEPREQASYLLALVVPALTAWGLSLLAHRIKVPRDAALARAALAVQCVVAGVVVAALAYQVRKVHAYFPPLRFAAGAVLTLAILAVARAAPRSAALQGWRRSRTGTRMAAASGLIALGAAAAFVAARLGSVVFDDASVVSAPATVSYHLPFTLGEFAAVLNGRTPGADFFPQYTFLLPYALAPAFRGFGLTVRTFTLAMAALSFVALMLHYDVLRRATGRPWVALALQVGFMGLAFHPVEVFPNGDVATAFSYFAVGPLRYFGPWVVAWLVALHASKPGLWRAAAVFAAAGASALNNLDWGFPALGGALVALALTGDGTVLPRPRTLVRIGAAATLGLAAAFAVFEWVSWARSGRFVSLSELTVFQRAFAVLGFGMIPMPRFGLHWIVYGTFMVGLGTALVRLQALRHTPGADPAVAAKERLLGAVLLYGSIFGAGALAYYVGRSHWAVLPAVFGAWGSVLVLLSWLALRAGGRTLGRHRVGLVPAALALGALALCAGEALPVAFPGMSLYERGSRVGAEKVRYVIEAPAAAERLRALASPGEKVMLAYPAGHLVAQLAGVENVFPFAEWDSCIVVGQVEEIASRIRAEGVTQYFGPASDDLRRRVSAGGLRVTFRSGLFAD